MTNELVTFTQALTIAAAHNGSDLPNCDHLITQIQYGEGWNRDVVRLLWDLAGPNAVERQGMYLPGYGGVKMVSNKYMEADILAMFNIHGMLMKVVRRVPRA